MARSPVNGYMVYPSGIQEFSLREAKKVANREAKELGGHVWVINVDTEKKVYSVGSGDARPRQRNPLKIGKWIKAKIKKLRNGKYRVEVPGYGLPYGMRPKDR